MVRNHPNIEVIAEEVTKIPDGPTIIATGPLSSEGMMKAIGTLIDDRYCYFYDAAVQS